MKWTPSILLLLCTAYAGTPLEDNVPDPSIHEDFAKLAQAIRKAENGGHGKEYGILNAKANTEELQLRWCLATCWKNWLRWQKTDMETPYLVFLANRYAPIGADNDPDNLNINWLPNVVAELEKP